MNGSQGASNNLLRDAKSPPRHVASTEVMVAVQPAASDQIREAWNAEVLAGREIGKPSHRASIAFLVGAPSGLEDPLALKRSLSLDVLPSGTCERFGDTIRNCACQSAVGTGCVLGHRI